MWCAGTRALTAEALRDFCRENLTAYKVPRRIEFRDSLPKTNVGKVLRRALRDEVLGRVETADAPRSPRRRAQPPDLPEIQARGPGAAAPREHRAVHAPARNP